MQTQATITIDRPVQDVWNFLDDHRNDLVWRRPSLQKLEQLGTGPVGVGTKFEGAIAAIGPKRYPYVNEITADEPAVLTQVKRAQLSSGKSEEVWRGGT